MQVNRVGVALRKSAQSWHIKRSPETSAHDLGARRYSSLEPEQFDWDHAVRAAAARLAEQYAVPDTAHHPLLAHQIEWLAALLTAFGKLAEEVSPMQTRMDEASLGKHAGTSKRPSSAA